MQIDLIDTFLDLCETRNFNRTAERLGVTQSTVSGRVQSLEKALECRLFRRSRSGTHLTGEGRRFEAHARSLRHGWVEARRAVAAAPEAGLTLRLGIQHDLVIAHLGEWFHTLRGALPEAGFYIEVDYSTQICTEVLEGGLDLGIVFTPKAHPDLQIESLGDVAVDMVTTTPANVADIAPGDYFLPNYAPAFFATHRTLLPKLSAARVSSGSHAVLSGLLKAVGGATYLLAESAAELSAAGLCQPVPDAPRIVQPVHAVLHLRNRHRAPHRRMLVLIRTKIGARNGADAAQTENCK